MNLSNNFAGKTVNYSEKWSVEKKVLVKLFIGRKSFGKNILGKQDWEK